MTKTAPAPLSIEHAELLADDLIRELTRHAGDDAAVCAVLLRWLDVLDSDGLAHVCMAAIRTTYGECLIPHPDRVPSDGLTIAAPGVVA